MTTVNVSKATGYAVRSVTDANVSKATGYAIRSTPVDSVAAVKATGYVALVPRPPEIRVPKATGYGVLVSTGPTDFDLIVSKATAYAISVDDPENYSYVTKATGYAILKGDFRISKATNYAVLDDLTPRFVQVSKSAGYSVLGSASIRVPKATGYSIMDTTPQPEVRVSKAVAYAVMFPLNPKIFLSNDVAEILVGGTGAARLSQLAGEVLTGGSGGVRLSQLAGDILTGGNPAARCAMIVAEVLCILPEEPYMIPTDRLFPTQAELPGLGFNVKKAPEFSTRIAGNVSGREVRNAFWDDPRWNYEVNFEMLRDRPVNDLESELKKIAGFFMQRRGKFEAFLFRDPDDFTANNLQALTDGVTLTFFFRRDFGGFNERVGQVDQSQAIDLWFRFGSEGEEGTVPVTPGPYTIMVLNAAQYRADVRVTLEDGTPLARVDILPGPMQYAVNSLTGVYTFNAAQQGVDVRLFYEFNISTDDYTILMPNRIVFLSAPDPGYELWSSFQFYFVCRFDEDTHEYEKFMDKLWELQQCTFKSIIQ